MVPKANVLQRKRDIFTSMNVNVINHENGELHYFTHETTLHNNSPLYVTGSSYSDFVKIILDKNGDLWRKKFNYNGKGGEPVKLNMVNINKDNSRTIPLVNIMLIGTPQEWIINYPKLLFNPYAHHFTSFKAFKFYLGLNHFDYELLVSVLEHESENLIKIIHLYDEQQDCINLLKKMDGQYTSLIDYYKMCLENQQPFKQPKGLNKLKELHDELVDIQNQKIYQHHSDEPCVEISFKLERTLGLSETKSFIETWEARGLEFKHLNSVKSILIQGANQKHCLGSYANQNDMERYSFFTFKYQDRNYDIQINTSGDVSQFKGYKNCDPPKELKEMVLDGVDLSHEIKLTRTDVFETNKASISTPLQMVNMINDRYGALVPEINNNRLTV